MTVTLEQSQQYNSLMKQIEAKNEAKKEPKNNAIPQQKTDEVHVRQAPRDREQVRSRSQEQERTIHNAEEEESNKFSFRKGEKVFDVDEDAEFEFMADKQPMKMTLKELRDAAAGGVAVRNRMRQISEERKALQEPFKDFVKISKDNPLGALERMFEAVQTIDEEADFNEFLQDLAKQAQSLAEMDPSERKAYELEKKLELTDEKLTHAQQMQKMAELKQDLMQETGLSEEAVYQLGQEILDDEVLSASIEDEEDLIDKIGDLATEVSLQQASYDALKKYDKSISSRDPLIFELSTILRNNPDFDEQDLEEIVQEVLSTTKKTKASQKLSKKHRVWYGNKSDVKSSSGTDYSKMTSFDSLKAQIEAKRNNNKNR